ncbi:MAG TPA: hypothetical protein VGZ03_05100 [Acidimicrobiales bacterium]|nr:hypothetical protein [Acidimicrobiales bacterium]
MVQSETAARRAPTPPPARTVSIVPAAAVLGIAVLTLGVFGLLNAFASSSTTSTTAPTIYGGLALGRTTAFAPWTRSGALPADVASALLVPAGARALGAVTTGGGGAGQFDREDRFVVAAPRARLLGFYRSNLIARGWAVISTSGTATGSAEVLFQKAGSDGVYWEAGVTASAATPTSATYTFRLFQVSDFS